MNTALQPPPILLVEDNPMDLDLTLRAFTKKRLTNHVQVARDGEEALAFMARWDAGEPLPAVILLDINLPKINGLEVLRQGGNAVDAAVAVGFALAVTFPYAGNLGGGGYMVIRMADGRTAAVDYREVAPLAATRDMYLDQNGKLTDESVVGYKASGVPGAVAGMAAALARFGVKPLRDVLQPAIRLAEEGFIVDSALFNSLT